VRRSTSQALPWTAGLRLVSMLLAAAVLAACGARSPGAQRFPEFAEYEDRRITDVRFLGTAPYAADTLQTLIQTEPSRCNLLGLPLCVPFTRIGAQTQRLDLSILGRDVDRLANFYRRKGYFGTVVVPRVQALNAENVRVVFAVDRADPIVLDSLGITGTDGILDPDSLARTLPLQAGSIFDLDRYNRSAEIVLNELRDRGHAYAEMLRNYSVDTLANSAFASLDAIAGPRVVVDSILVFGATNLGYRATLRQLPFRRGDVLVFRQLVDAHRNLYNLELVQFATVRVAPDSLQAAPEDSTRATVEVRIAEAAPRQIDAAIGYGTVECFRTDVRWVNRSFLGGARRLAATANLSRIGIANPLDAGFAGSICPAFRADEDFAQELDYHFGTEFTQPYFLSPRNHLTAQLFAERVSEPRVFQREAQGGRLALNRRLATRTLVTGAVDVEHGATLAPPALYCVAFQVCLPEDIELLQQPRFKNMVSLNVMRDRTDALIDPTSGYVTRTNTAYAPGWLGSDVRFVRWTGEAAAYQLIRPRWVGAVSLRIGNFFRTATFDPQDNFLPPEERFYAGGANSVRGFERNGLGPGVYVIDQPLAAADAVEPDTTRARFVPVGGTSMAIANVELRLPSPFLTNIVRFAAFVDAGALGTDHLWHLDARAWRVTPGAGLRLQTPVGPIRFDVAFNPHDPQPGPLFATLVDEGTGLPTGLVRIRDTFRPPPRGFLERFRIHAAIGQAF
jgi:outer membrane protein assembly factor BamA